MDRSLWRKCTKYTLSVIALFIGTEIVYRCLRYFSACLSSKDASETTYYYKVLFFPDEGILSHLGQQKPDDLSTYVLDADAATEGLSLGESPSAGDSVFMPHQIPDLEFHSFLREGNSSRSSNPRHSFDPLLKSTSLVHMVDVLDAAERSLLVCVYLISSSDLLDAIIRAKDRGLRVRVILDRGMSSVSNLAILLKSCVPVRCSKPSQMMHNKFAVADAPDDLNRLGTASTKGDSFPVGRRTHSDRRGKRKANGGVLMTGSFNWTWNAVISNYENVVVTNDRRLISAYAEEFEKLWDLFSQTEFTEASDLDLQIRT